MREWVCRDLRHVWVVLLICGLPVIAAEKRRDWQTGQILETRVEQSTLAWGSILHQKTALVDRELHTIASADKNYLVTGQIGRGKQAAVVGMSVRFAVEGKTMFISIADKEYRLRVLEESVAPRSLDSPPPNEAVAKTADAGEPLDNDAVVKMVVGGLKEETVIRVIEARHGKFALAPDAVLALKAAGVSPSVIGAMAAKMGIQAQQDGRL